MINPCAGLAANAKVTKFNQFSPTVEFFKLQVVCFLSKTDENKFFSKNFFGQECKRPLTVDVVSNGCSVATSELLIKFLSRQKENLIV